MAAGAGNMLWGLRRTEWSRHPDTSASRSHLPEWTVWDTIADQPASLSGSPLTARTKPSAEAASDVLNRIYKNRLQHEPFRPHTTRNVAGLSKQPRGEPTLRRRPIFLTKRIAGPQFDIELSGHGAHHLPPLSISLQNGHQQG